MRGEFSSMPWRVQRSAITRAVATHEAGHSLAAELLFPGQVAVA